MDLNIVQPVTDKNKNMEKKSNIFSARVSRKKFFVVSAVSVAGIYAFFKMPFRSFFNKKENNSTKSNAVKINLNPDAVSRNSGRNNG